MTASRVRVQVEQPAAALHRRGQVAQVLQLQLAVEVPGPADARRPEPTDKIPVPFGSSSVRR